MNGRLSTFIELGVGFTQDLAARDNVMINGTMIGLSPREARRRFDAVIDFAELREFEELKLKNYSSGMDVRLAFSVVMQVDAEVLLIDEVLAVGDASFQQKCFDEFARIRREGRTVLLVTHDMGNVQRFCDRAMLLERGTVVELGAPDRVASRYLELNFNRAMSRPPARTPMRALRRPPRIVEAWFEDDAGVRAKTVPGGGKMAICCRARFKEGVEDPLFGVVLADDRGTPVFEASNLLRGPSGAFAAGEESDHPHRLRQRPVLGALRDDAGNRPRRQRGGLDRPARALRLGRRHRRAFHRRGARRALRHRGGGP